jgi:hypothetical protein
MHNEDHRVGLTLPSPRPLGSVWCEPAGGLVLGLAQKALFSGRERRVVEHALIVQLGKVVQPR